MKNIVDVGMASTMRDIIRDEIQAEKDRHRKAISDIVKRNINFDKESTYYYPCQGSGYYLRFNDVIGETVVFDIYSKGGIKKSYKFYINWYGINLIKKITL